MIAKRTVNLQDGRLLILEAINARHVKLYTNSNNLQTFVSSEHSRNSIIRLDINNEFIIDLLDPDLSKLHFNITNTFIANYYLTKIIKSGLSTYLLETMPRTVSSFFIPPIVVPSKDWLDWNRLFCNAYFVKIKQPKERYYVGLMFRFLPTDAYHNLESKLIKLSTFFKHYPWDYDYELFTFVVNESQSNDLNLLLDSKYSRVSESYKAKILYFNKFSATGDMAKILCKHPDRRRQLELDLECEINEETELFEAVDLEKELLIITDNVLQKLGRVGQLT